MKKFNEFVNENTEWSDEERSNILTNRENSMRKTDPHLDYDEPQLGLLIAHTFSDNMNGPYTYEYYGMSEEEYNTYTNDIQLAIEEYIEKKDNKLS